MVKQDDEVSVFLIYELSGAMIHLVFINISDKLKKTSSNLTG